MTTSKMIAVMQAAVDGKAIEYRCKGISGQWLQWIQVANPTWDWQECEYRVKPEPREWWILNCKQYVALFGTKTEAESAACDRQAEIILVREVIE